MNQFEFHKSPPFALIPLVPAYFPPFTSMLEAIVLTAREDKHENKFFKEK